MKIYNINDTKHFFKVVSECNGDVALVREDGSQLALNKEESLNVLAETYVNGSIKEMELSFTDGEDAVKMFQYLTSMANVA